MKHKIDNSVIHRYTPDIKFGLSDLEVENRIKAGLINKSNIKTGKTYLQIILSNIINFFNLLMTGIAVLFIIFFGINAIGNISYMFILIANTLIGIIQECKAKHTVDKLKLLNTDKITVIRNCGETKILPDKIVADDIIFLKAGDQIPADCILLSGNISTNESLLTGETHSIKKHINDKLYAGSSIANGSCYCIAENVGDKTYISSLESKTKVLTKVKSYLTEEINKIIHKLTAVVIPIGILTFWNILMNSNSTIKESLPNAVSKAGSTIVGMLPCGMLLLASVAMATGVMKLSTKNTLVKELNSVESLARVNSICLDKTGTLTDGNMTLDTVLQLNFNYDLEKLMPIYLGAFDDENATSRALIDRYGKSTVKSTEFTPFSSDTKYSSVKIDDVNYALGAPDFLTTDENVLKLISEYTAKGFRTVILLNKTENEVIAIFIIKDNIRPSVKKTMQWFTENDVEIRVISGDNIDTVKHIAKRAGIPNYEKAIDLSTVSDEEFAHAVKHNYIFGRVTPEQKVAIVDVLHEQDKVVAMTGDGVNDILAMKKADCGIAMANGSPSTKNVANLILLDSNFDNMPEAVFQGRRVINNIQRSSTLFLMKDFFTLFLSIYCLLTRVNFPIETSIIGIVNLLITGIGSLFISLEPSTTRIDGNFSRNVLGKAIPAGLFIAFPCIIIVTWGIIACGIKTNNATEWLSMTNDWIANKVSVMGFCITVAGFIVFYKVCQPFTKFRRILWGLTLGLGALILCAFPEFYLRNSTDFWPEITNAHTDLTGVNKLIAIVDDIFSRFFSFSLYKDFFTLEDWILIIVFSVTGFVIYHFTDKLVSKILKIKMFDVMLYDDNKDDSQK